MGSDLTAERELGRDAAGDPRVTVRLRGLVDLATEPVLRRDPLRRRSPFWLNCSGRG